MVERGEVTLDDPVQKYLPDGVKCRSAAGRRSRCEHLATHTSGLPRLPTNLAPNDAINPYADYTVEQMYDFLADYEPTRDAATQYEYCNLGVGPARARAGAARGQELRDAGRNAHPRAAGDEEHAHHARRRR